MAARSAHWDEVYTRLGPEGVSWYQPHLGASLGLVGRLAPTPTSLIDVGGGASTLAGDLLARGWSDVTVLDLSPVALAEARRRLGPHAASVHWIEGDVTEVELPAGRFGVWHDRAVFHFLLDAAARRRYVDAVRRALRPDGHLVIATFALDGPRTCSGLEVQGYDAMSLWRELGRDFAPVESVEERYATPSGEVQRLIYCAFRRM